MESLIHEFRSPPGSVCGGRGFTVLTILTLGMGISAVTTMYSEDSQRSPESLPGHPTRGGSWTCRSRICTIPEVLFAALSGVSLEQVWTVPTFVSTALMITATVIAVLGAARDGGQSGDNSGA